MYVVALMLLKNYNNFQTFKGCGETICGYGQGCLHVHAVKHPFPWESGSAPGLDGEHIAGSSAMQHVGIRSQSGVRIGPSQSTVRGTVMLYQDVNLERNPGALKMFRTDR